MTAAARQEAIAIFLAAVHVCVPGLVDPPTGTITRDRAPFRTVEELWAWAAHDPAVSAIRARLDPGSAARVRAVLRGMLRERATG